MNIYKYINEYKGTKNLAIAIGKFDGLHKGHQSLIDQIVEFSDMPGTSGQEDSSNINENESKQFPMGKNTKEDIETMVIAFDMEAYFKEHGIDYQVLSTSEEKLEKLEKEYGYLLDHVLMCHFTDEIAHMEPEEFVKEILVDKLHCKYLVVGTDFRFGKGAKGDTWKLEQLGEVYDFEVHIMEKEKHKGEIISSTSIKSLVQKSAMEEVRELLTEPYTITSEVIHGAKLGRTIGFPTLNLAVPVGKVLPQRGVYSCRIHMEGEIYLGVGNLGRKPTVSDEPVDLLEVHIFDFSGNVYGHRVKVELLEFHRPEQKFESLDELIKQLHFDTQLVKSKM